jgi:CRISPR-associated protein Csd1
VILQTLNNYYERLKGFEESLVPPMGYTWRPISFALIIASNGKLAQVQDLREESNKKLVPKQMMVPSLGRKKSSGVDPDFLWGSTSYVLGDDDSSNPERTSMKLIKFKEFQHQLGDGFPDEGLAAFLNFLDAWNPVDIKTISAWSEMKGKNVVFRLDGKREYTHESQLIREMWAKYYLQDDIGGLGTCLISGEKTTISRLHPGIKGVDDTATAESALVSFNEESSCSYGKAQNFNAPVSKIAAFGYTSALNYLLKRDNRQRVKVGDAITVFWTARESPIEGFMGLILNPREDAGDLQQIRIFLEALRDGKMPQKLGDPDISFYILGLSPSAARISVRYWYVSTVGDIAEKIGQHFRDLTIVKQYENSPEFPGMWQLLRQTAVQSKTDNIPPLLAGAVMRSILTGGRYPQTLLTSIIGRIRADQDINYLRAAIIKACLVRKYRVDHIDKEVEMTLDKESKNVAYRLGRLFAVLEKVQKDAIPGANTTIKDRFYDSASATPRVVFPQLLRLAQHHIQKAEKYGKWSDKMIEEIMCDLLEFPAHLSFDDQGMFAIGYYHQRQAFFTKSKDEKEDSK